MPIQPTVKIEGVKELRAKLSALGEKGERKATRGAIRKAGNVVLKNVRKRVKKNSGKTAKALAVKVSVTSGGESARIGARRRAGGRAFHLLEFGTRGHGIRAKNRKYLEVGGRVLGKRIRHPGTRAQPALRPGFEESQGEALQKFKDEMQKVIAEVKGMPG